VISMESKALLELLAAHADALNRDETVDTADWLADYPSEAGHIVSLLQLARVIKQALAPVHPSALFKNELRQRLLQADFAPEANGSSHRAVWWGAAVVGSVLSITGLALWLLRRSWPAQNQSQAMTV